ncbi:MAG: hypothetical protein JNL08_07120 [Planctomycetes bacterium]|nr:hypothetical protein [Planctomycetota bacterium]
MSKSIPFSLLAFAVSASLVTAQDGPASGGWSAKPGSGLKFDGGDAFGLKWNNRIQVHWTYANNEDFAGNTGDDTNTFNIRRLRTTFSGHAFSRNLLYRIDLDGTDSGAAGDGNVKESWAQWNFCNCEGGTVGLRVGQSKTQFGLERAGSSGGLWFVERASVSRAFSDSFTRGAWLVGAMANHQLRWTAAAANTDVAGGLSTNLADRGEETANGDNELDYTFTVNFDPLGDFFGGAQTTEPWRQGDFRDADRPLVGTIGAALSLGNSLTSSALPGTTGVTDVETTAININTAWKVSGFHVLGEYFLRTDDLQDTTIANEEEPSGWAVSIGYLLPKSGDSAIQWGLGVRVDEIETDDGNDGTVHFLTGAQGIGVDLGTVREISVVANAFYHGHACKTQIEYTFQDVDIDAGAASDRTNHIVRIGFQLEI